MKQTPELYTADSAVSPQVPGPSGNERISPLKINATGAEIVLPPGTSLEDVTGKRDVDVKSTGISMALTSTKQSSTTSSTSSTEARRESSAQEDITATGLSGSNNKVKSVSVIGKQITHHHHYNRPYEPPSQPSSHPFLEDTAQERPVRRQLTTREGYQNSRSTGNEENQWRYNECYSQEIVNFLVHNRIVKTEDPVFISHVFTNQTTERCSFVEQFKELMALKNNIVPDICFIATEPSPTHVPHYICGVLTAHTLLVINPIGLSKHSDFNQALEKIHECYQLKVYLSTNTLQKESGGLICCGPICVELVLSILAKTRVEWATSLKKIVESGKSKEHESDWLHQVNIRALLPVALKGLSNLSDEEYQKRLASIRVGHRQLIPCELSEGSSWAECKYTDVSRISVPDTIRYWSSFKELVGSEIYIDKTLLIKEIIIEPSNIVIFLAPKRFFKTTNLEMLFCFFSSTDQSENLFKSRAIAKELDESNLKGIWAYPVIFINFKDIKGTSFDDCYNLIIEEVRGAYITWDFLLRSEKIKDYLKDDFSKIVDRKAEKAQMGTSLKKLSELLHIFYEKKVVILIDEFDTPLQASFKNEKHYENMRSFLEVFLGAALKGNANLSRAILVGSTNPFNQGIFSSAYNMSLYGVYYANKFTPYFCLTEKEVLQLIPEVKEELTRIRKWYSIGECNGETLYNPTSIMSFRVHRRYESYWMKAVKEGAKEILNRIPKPADFNKDIALLLKDKKITKEITPENISFQRKNTTHFWNYLVLAGLLKVERQNLSELQITNEESREYFDELLPRKRKKNLIKNSSIPLPKPLDETERKSLISSLRGRIKPK